VVAPLSTRCGRATAPEARRRNMHNCEMLARCLHICAWDLIIYQRSCGNPSPQLQISSGVPNGCTLRLALDTRRRHLTFVPTLLRRTARSHLMLTFDPGSKSRHCVISCLGHPKRPPSTTSTSSGLLEMAKGWILMRSARRDVCSARSLFLSTVSVQNC
jgi:hypothetical protein